MVGLLPVSMRRRRLWTLGSRLGSVLSLASTSAENSSIRGLGVWKSPSVLDAPRGAETLRDFCQSEGINEVYVSFPAREDASLEHHFAHLISLLHRSQIRVEALLNSPNADEAGKPREKLLGTVREVAAFNRNHPAARFDGIHLDIEPQQRLENKGSVNLAFLSGLVDAYRAVREQADREGLSVNADFQEKLLKGTLAERRMVLTSLQRLTLMFYEVNSPGGASATQQTEKLRSPSQDILKSAYDGLNDSQMAQMVIGLRTPDYGDLLPQMLRTLGETNRTNPHYRGWARHSYNDYLNTVGEPHH
jgi:hypothetical protein